MQLSVHYCYWVVHWVSLFIMRKQNYKNFFCVLFRWNRKNVIAVDVRVFILQFIYFTFSSFFGSSFFHFNSWIYIFFTVMLIGDFVHAICAIIRLKEINSESVIDRAFLHFSVASSSFILIWREKEKQQIITFISIEHLHFTYVYQIQLVAMIKIKLWNYVFLLNNYTITYRSIVILWKKLFFCFHNVKTAKNRINLEKKFLNLFAEIFNYLRYIPHLCERNKYWIFNNKNHKKNETLWHSFEKCKFARIDTHYNSIWKHKEIELNIPNTKNNKLNLGH